jgi:hydroxymethylpyrimidine pyrophosphatase-like HAD family hydrolase
LPGAATLRLIKEWEQHGKLIVAYDFDGTVHDYHKEGNKYDQVIELLRECKKLGCYLIVFSTSEPERHDFIKNYLDRWDIPYDAVNENMPGLPFKGGKIYYNILLDDRAGLESAYYSLKQASSYIKLKREETNND